MTAHRTRVQLTALMLAIAAGLPLAATAQQPAPAPKAAAPAAVQPPAGHPAEPQTDPNAANFPLKFETLNHEFGDIPDTDKVSFAFKFKNETQETITIKAVNGSCGCTVPTLTKMIYAPGEAGEITATFDPTNRVGPQPKTVTVSLDDPTGRWQPLILHLNSTVKPFVYVDNTKLHFIDIMKNTESKQLMHVIGRSADFKVTGIDIVDKASFDAKIGEPEAWEDPAAPEGSKGEKLVRVPIEIVLKPSSNLGMRSSQVTITTNDSRKPTVQTFLAGTVVGEARTMPPTMYIRETRPSVPFEAQAQIDSRLGKSFEITGLDVEGPSDMSLVVDFEPASPNGNPGYTIKLSGVTQGVPGQQRGTVTIKTNMENEPDIKLMFYANVAPQMGTPVPNQPQIQPAPKPTGPVGLPQATKPGTGSGH